MLVTTRRIGEKLVIGDGIVLTLLSTRGGKVRIGLAAPASVRIARWETLRAAQGLASGNTPDDSLAGDSLLCEAAPSR